ncbi:MAG: DnaJ domain-containing protein [Chitinophagaceae bacterium]|jgi:curved DNA-binding protein CbpA|nr:DnaJ domain-containing protein [Chitinophagaceae bacterium]
MQQKNYYQILQVDAYCNAEAIKKAYRKLALQYHPDVAQNNSFYTQKFAEIKEAYEILSNPEKRKKFHEAYFFTPLAQPVNSIHDVIPLAIKIEQYTKETNIYTIDYTLIRLHIEDLLLKHSFIIIQSQEIQKKEQLANHIFNALTVLPFEILVKLQTQLLQCFPNKEQAYANLLAEKKKHFFWDKYAVVVAVVVTIGLCVMIALMA